MPKIKVHEKALAHLSRGLYRSPASAIRELVSNAWDANATEVRISTNYPDFYEVRIQDNGTGFTKSDFETIMQGGTDEIGGIGNSRKRSQDLSLIHNRPIIGRLGIGMLGIATFCPGFTITSKTKDGGGFKARIRLYDLLKQKLDSDDPEFVRPDEIDVGEYSILEDDLEKAEVGTLIVADDVHPTFIRSFKLSCATDGFKEPSINWLDNLVESAKVHSVKELGEYWRLLWELAAACPIPYIDGEALPGNLITADHNRLSGYDFNVVVDSIRLAKPVLLNDPNMDYTCHEFQEDSFRPYGKPLKFHGYFVVQEGLQLKPEDLRGILIRIKDVAIGYYDNSLLGYRFNEGPRTRWVTGEVFIDDGLEDALNLDRESFNRFHPEFRELQEYIHGILQLQVFPEVYKKIAKRSKKKKVARKKHRSESLAEVISNVRNAKVSLVEAEPSPEAKTSPQVIVTQKKKTFEVVLPSTEDLKIKRANRDLAAALLAVYEVSLLESSPKEKRDTFRRLVLELLNKW